MSSQGSSSDSEDEAAECFEWDPVVGAPESSNLELFDKALRHLDEGTEDELGWACKDIELAMSRWKSHIYTVLWRGTVCSHFAPHLFATRN